MEAAQQKGQPPVELVQAWDGERWHALPERGGLLDQDYVLMDRMSALSNVYRTVARLRNLKGEQIHSLTGGERAIIRILLDNELL